MKFWLLAAIIILALPSLRYLWRHIAERMARRTLYGRRGPTNWRTPWGVPRSICALLLLGAIAAYLFTPHADALAGLPILGPLVSAALGGILLVMVVRGLAHGTIRPLTEHIFNRYDRRRDPWAYWASVVWNAAIGGFLFAIGITLIATAPRDAMAQRCNNFDGPPNDIIAACSGLLTLDGEDAAERAAWFAARGSAQFRLRAIPAAMADYRRSIKLDPVQRYTRYNLALTLIETRRTADALRELDRAVLIDPDHLDTRLRRAELYVQSGQPQRAIDDLTDFHRRRPIEPIPIAMRGTIYASLGKDAEASADFARARAIEPGNAIAVKGEAILACEAGDWRGAIPLLSVALEQYPGDRFLIALRAEAYRQVGDTAQANRDGAAMARATH